MEWLINTWNEFYLHIVGTGAVGIIAFKTFVLDYINNKKSLNNFGSVIGVTSSIKNDVKKIVEVEISKVLKGEELIFEKFTNFQNVVETLVKKIDDMEKENTTLVNLLVHSYSLVNVPLNKKEETFKALKSISSINETVMQSLKVSIEQDISKNKEIKTEIDNKLNDLDKVIV